MEILSRGGLKLMKDGHIQNIQPILFTYLHLQPFKLKAKIQFSKSHNLKLAGYHCDCPLGGKVVQPRLTSCIQECTLLWSAVAMSVLLPASSSLLDSPLKDSRQAQSELNILNMGLLEDTDLYFQMRQHLLNHISQVSLPTFSDC